MLRPLPSLSRFLADTLHYPVFQAYYAMHTATASAYSQRPLSLKSTSSISPPGAVHILLYSSG